MARGGPAIIGDRPSAFRAAVALLARASQDREDEVVRRLRIPVPHCKADAPIIDAFQCSECEWSYRMRQPQPYTISWADAARVSREFDDHRCEDFPRNGRASPPAHFKSMRPRFIGMGQ